MKHWLLQSFIALDQLVNAILFQGYADETISSRAHREFPRLARVIDALFFFDPGHCEASYVSEKLRSQAPPELRK